MQLTAREVRTKYLVIAEHAQFLEEASALIRAADMSYEDIADAAGVSVHTISRYGAHMPRAPRFLHEVLKVIGYKIMLVKIQGAH